jgi:polysaccharide biosynthesis protein VpsM
MGNILILEQCQNERNPMHSNRIIIILFCTIMAATVFPVRVHAGSKFNVIPKISAGWEIDSNFYRAEEREREVYTYTIQPGLKVDFKSPKTSLMLDYTLKPYHYDDRDPVLSGEKPSDDDDYTGHTFIGEARYQAFDRLLLGLNESYNKTRDPAQSDAFSNSVDRSLYQINMLTPFVAYEFGRKFSARLRYRRTNIDYAPEEREDSKENRGIFDLIYNLTPKNSLDLEYQYWQKDYDWISPDYSSNQAMLIFRKELRIFRIEAGVGYQNRNFDDPGLDDLDAFIYKFNIGGKGTIANRRSYIAFNIDQNLNDQTFDTNYFLATRFTLSGGHEFSRKLLGEVSAYYQISDYERTYGLTPGGTVDQRKDDTTELSGTISYKFARWLIFSVTAGYQNRDSNLAGLSYDNNFFISRLEFAYDWAENNPD